MVVLILILRVVLTPIIFEFLRMDVVRLILIIEILLLIRELLILPTNGRMCWLLVNEVLLSNLQLIYLLLLLLEFLIEAKFRLFCRFFRDFVSLPT
jgi:hypothetical protein